MSLKGMLGRRQSMSIIKPYGKQLGAETLRFCLCDVNREMGLAWAESFADVDSVEIRQGSLFDLTCQAILSPANSFGDMSGGIDRLIDNAYGGRAQLALLALIRDHFLGEMPVGMASIIEFPGSRFPYLIGAPTMRTPGSVAKDSLNAYLAFRAALVTLLLHNQMSASKILTLAVPGLCTGVGGIEFRESAQQMRVAYDNVIEGVWRDVVHPAMAPYPTGVSDGKRWSWTKPDKDS